MAGAAGDSGLTHAGRQCALTHVLQLRAGRHLLGEQRGLDAVEQPFEPTDQLGLRDAQFGVGRDAVLGERQGQPLEFVTQLGSQAVLEFADGRGVDLAQPGAARVVQRSCLTSSRSCLIIVPIRITLAGCSTSSVIER